MKQALILICSIVIFASCKVAEISSVPANTELYGSKWVLNSVKSAVDDSRLTPELGDKKPALLFYKNTGAVTGLINCNRLTAKADIEGARVKFEEISSSNIYCEISIKSMEHAIKNALEVADNFEINSGKLFIKHGDLVLAEYFRE